MASDEVRTGVKRGDFLVAAAGPATTLSVSGMFHRNARTSAIALKLTGDKGARGLWPAEAKLARVRHDMLDQREHLILD